MRKLPLIGEVEPVPLPRQGQLIRNLAAIAVGVLLAPIIYEGALLCASGWHQVWHRTLPVHTPVLDAIRGTLHGFWMTTRLRIHEAFQHLPWRPSLVIGLGIGWAIFMSVPLKKTH